MIKSSSLIELKKNIYKLLCYRYHDSIVRASIYKALKSNRNTKNPVKAKEQQYQSSKKLTKEKFPIHQVINTEPHPPSTLNLTLKNIENEHNQKNFPLEENPPLKNKSLSSSHWVLNSMDIPNYDFNFFNKEFECLKGISAPFTLPPIAILIPSSKENILFYEKLAKAITRQTLFSTYCEITQDLVKIKSLIKNKFLLIGRLEFFSFIQSELVLHNYTQHNNTFILPINHSDYYLENVKNKKNLWSKLLQIPSLHTSKL